LTKAKTTSPADDNPPMRERIKQVARDLFIRHGLGEVSYGDIAAKVGTTRANLHYHFGNKAEMIETIFGETFKSVEEKYNAIWLAPGLSLDERIRLTQEDSRKRFYEFNKDRRGKVPWSLSARARGDDSLLTPELLAGMANMSRQFEAGVTHAVQEAIAAGELRPDTPGRAIVLLITPVWHFGSHLTRFGGLNKLLEHYTAVRIAIRDAYGTEKYPKLDLQLRDTQGPSAGMAEVS
jgi:AcrR family transcriptional regulator